MPTIERAFDVVARVIRDWDPYGLLRGGCPDDEFDAEIQSVVREIPRIKSANDAAQVLCNVFSSAFDRESFRLESCFAIGSKLFAALSENCLTRN